MNKRKILLLAALLCMTVILAAGSTLAYFMDTDGATNVFTIGHIDIELDETFEQNSELMPNKKVDKIVNVKNIGANPAYVRVHIAIPQILDSGDPYFAAYDNTLHFNMSKESLADGQWNWHANNVNGNTYAGYPENGGDWNFYTVEIDGIWYNVYVATYETALAPKGEAGSSTATPAMHSVYLDALLTQERWDEIQEVLGYENVKVLVAVEGVQVDTFDNAYDALNTAFGIPGKYTTNWADNEYNPAAVPSDASASEDAAVVTE